MAIMNYAKQSSIYILCEHYHLYTDLYSMHDSAFFFFFIIHKQTAVTFDNSTSVTFSNISLYYKRVISILTHFDFYIRLACSVDSVV